MYRSVTLAVCSLAVLVSWVSCHPAERAETPQKSPVDIIVETKDGIGFNVIQRKLINALNPKPIVDTITEEEKYGNTQQHELGRKLVKGVERVSKFVNNVVAVPDNAAKQGSRKLTEILDNIGGRIVGLQK